MSLAIRIQRPNTPRPVAGKVVKFDKGRDPPYVLVKVPGEPTSIWFSRSECLTEVIYPDELDPHRAGPRVRLPSVIEPIGFSRPIEPMLNGVELYCGSGNLSSSFERAGFEMTRLDRSLEQSDDLHWSVDFGELDAQALTQLLSVTYVHASPDCSTFSNLATSKHQRRINNNFLGATDKAWQANGLLLKLYRALKARLDAAPCFFTIENPECSFVHHPLIKQMVDELDGTAVVRLSFCAFGESFKKNTTFVTNSPTLIRLTQSDRLYCGPHCTGKCAFSFKPHTNITVRPKVVGRIDKRMRRFGSKKFLRQTTEKSGGKRTLQCGVCTADATAFPSLLTDFVANSVKRDILELQGRYKRCTNTCCEFVFNHKGVCSHMLSDSKDSRRKR